MKVAVTGATGFVGRHVLRTLSTRAGVEVTASSRNPVPPGSLPIGIRHVALDVAAPSPDDYDRLGRPDVLLHLAWSGLPNYRSLHHFETELPSQYSFLRCLVEAGLPSLFVAGTCYEYGMKCGVMHESMVSTPCNPYAFAKNALRQQLEYLCLQKEVKLIWARLFYMYGVGQASSSLFAQLMAAVSRRDSSFKMSGGEQLRDYLPVEEVARLMVELATEPAAEGIFNICSGRPVSVRTLVERLLAEQNAALTLDLGSFPYPDYEPMAFWGSRERVDSVLAHCGGLQ